jgi:CRP/FNR family transcriptional regulator, anaerobic regulatory protein
MNYTNELENLSRQFGKDVMDHILESSSIIDFPENAELIREGQYVKGVPIVLEGMVKVFAGEGSKEILLYYIQPGESCVMSLSACLKNEKSKVCAIATEYTSAILLPCDKLNHWILHYPVINRLFYLQYDRRYTELIGTVNHLLFDKLEKRLIDYLKEKKIMTGKNPIKISHKEIAKDLGTAREVVSRLIKKLENQQKLQQHHDSIELL